MTINSTHISFCNNIEGNQTNVSHALRSISVALGIISIIGGVIGMYTFGALGGGLLIGGGGFLVFLGSSLSCVSKNGKEDSKEVGHSPTTLPNDYQTDTLSSWTDVQKKGEETLAFQNQAYEDFKTQKKLDEQKLKDCEQMLRQDITEDQELKRLGNITKENSKKFDQTMEETKALLDECKSRFKRKSSEPNADSREEKTVKNDEEENNTSNRFQKQYEQNQQELNESKKLFEKQTARDLNEVEKNKKHLDELLEKDRRCQEKLKASDEQFEKLHHQIVQEVERDSEVK